MPLAKQNGKPDMTVAQLDALALRVRTRAAKYLNAIEMVRELLVAEGTDGETNMNKTHDESMGGALERAAKPGGKGDEPKH